MSRLSSSAPEFIPSGIRTPSPSVEEFQPVQSKKNKKINSGELWFSPKGWLKFYRCQACHQVMSRKEPSRCPQVISACGHITCAKCIATSFLVELNPYCPVEGCGTCVNPKQTEPVRPVAILAGASSPAAPAEIEETFDTHYLPTFEEYDLAPTYELTENKTVHYCGDSDCEWDCGVLYCGCIDICRNRCGLHPFISKRR
jgi:hypothetical protein